MNLRSAPSTGPEVEIIGLGDGEVHAVSGQLTASDGVWYELRRGWVRASSVLARVDDTRARRASLDLQVASGLEGLALAEPELNATGREPSAGEATELESSGQMVGASDVAEVALPAVSANAPVSREAEVAVPWDDPPEGTGDFREEQPAAESIADAEAGLEPESEEFSTRRQAELFKQMRYRR
jgi:hypothetical protein